MKAQNETLVVPNAKQRTELLSKLSKSGTRFTSLYVKGNEVLEMRYISNKPSEHHVRHGLLSVWDIKRSVHTTINPRAIKFFVLGNVRYKFPVIDKVVFPKPIALRSALTPVKSTIKKVDFPPIKSKLNDKIKAKEVPAVVEKVVKKLQKPESEDGKIIKVVKVPKKAKVTKSVNPFIEAAKAARKREKQIPVVTEVVKQVAEEEVPVQKLPKVNAKRLQDALISAKARG